MFVIIIIKSGGSTKYYAPLTWEQVKKFLTEKGFKQMRIGEFRYWWHRACNNMHATVHKLEKID